MAGSNNDNALGVALLILGGLAAFAIWKLSSALGLQFQTGLSVAGRSTLPLGLLIGFTFSERWWEPARLANTWWLVLAAAWWTIWPALDDWGGALSMAPEWMLEGHVRFYAQDWFQWLGCLVILAIGGWLTWRRDRY